MSKMSELAIEIEEGIEQGQSIDELVDGIVGFGLSRSYALKLVNNVVDLYCKEKDGYEIQ